MTNTRQDWLVRALLGGAVGVALHLLWGYFWGSFSIIGPVHFDGFLFYFGDLPEWLGNILCFALWAVFGAETALATLPFADEGGELLWRSLLHYVIMALTLTAWVTLNFRERGFATFLLHDLPTFLVPFTLVYVLIWLGRWVGWYAEAAAIRERLGLTPGPSPLKWKETLPHLAFSALLCLALPFLLRLVDAPDVPVLCGILLPYILLPIGGFFSALSLGKRQGFCPLYPLSCGVFYLPAVFLLFNATALFHCLMAAVPALVGNLAGAGLRAVKRRRTARA